MANKSSTLILSLKFTLISTGVLFIALLISLSLPNLYSSAPNIWSSFCSWLKPPYLYIIINCIIITIAASSRLHYKHVDHSSTHDLHHLETFVKDSSSATQHLHHDRPHDHAPPIVMSEGAVMNFEVQQYGDHTYGAAQVKDVVDYVIQETMTSGATHGDQKIGDELVVKEVDDANKVSFEMARSDFVRNYGYEVRRGGGDFAAGKAAVVVEKEEEKKKSMIAPPERQDSIAELLAKVAERPPLSASARFGHHRRPARAVPEGGKTLRVVKPKKQETLESTWKAITEGRHMPLTRHLRENHLNSSASPETRAVKKSETSQDRTNYTSPTATATATEGGGGGYLGKLKKEPSLSQDELNRRVEAFIKKFNEDMRLQRQQSIQQFLERINRAM